MADKTYVYFVRPRGMAAIGDYLWPAGLPEGSSNPQDQVPYMGEDGKHFYICYTPQQILKQVLRYGCFSPYTPLMVTGTIGPTDH